MRHYKLQRVPDIRIAVVPHQRRIALELPEVIIDIIEIWMMRALQQVDPEAQARISTAHEERNSSSVEMAEGQGGEMHFGVTNSQRLAGTQKPLHELTSGCFAFDHHRYGQLAVIHYCAAMLRYMAVTSLVGPSATTCPLSSQIVLSQNVLRSSVLWDENTKILPCSMNSTIRFFAFSAKRMSPAAITSSSRRISGLMLVETANARRMNMPEE